MSDGHHQGLLEPLQVLEDAYHAEQMANVGALRASIAEELGALEVTRDAYGIAATFALADVCWRMRWVWLGRFLMGSPKDERGRRNNEGSQHYVVLTRGYWLGETPVTQALWNAVTGENPSLFEGRERPVEQVNWVDARSFCEALGARLPILGPRLPSEAEWEYACRAGTITATWLGDDTHSDSLDPVAWHRRNSGGTTRPVGQKQANPWGFHDVLGNVWEWCADRVDFGVSPCPSGPRVDPWLQQGWRRVSRGGGWPNLAHDVRAARRRSFDPGARWPYLGFRVAGGPALGPTPEREAP